MNVFIAFHDLSVVMPSLFHHWLRCLDSYSRPLELLSVPSIDHAIYLSFISLYMQTLHDRQQVNEHGTGTVTLLVVQE